MEKEMILTDEEKALLAALRDPEKRLQVIEILTA